MRSATCSPTPNRRSTKKGPEAPNNMKNKFQRAAQLSALIVTMAAVSVMSVGCESFGDYVRDFKFMPDSSDQSKKSSDRRGSQSYFNNWKKYYKERGLSDKEATERAADKHYFKYHKLPATGSKDD